MIYKVYCELYKDIECALQIHQSLSGNSKLKVRFQFLDLEKV